MLNGGMILSDTEILDLIDAGMITPAERELIGRAEGIMSFGLSSYGYDFRLGEDFTRYKSRAPDNPLDPRKVTEDDVVRFQAKEVIIPAKGFLLGTTIEYVRMPRDLTGLPHDKSTPARCGIVIQNTVVEAGFEGNITMEIYNYQPFPVTLRAGEGVCQILFLRGLPCRTSYAERMGKYMGQVGTTLPRA
jgi:dCTP deaminase